METYQEFLNRINSFEQDFDLSKKNFEPNPAVLVKIDEQNHFKSFYGDTAVFVLSPEEQEFFNSYTDLLYKKAPECFAERLHSETFQMTLHDLSNSPFESKVSEKMKQNEIQLRNMNFPKIQIFMKFNAVFNMNHTALCIGLFPADDAEYQKLMQLYELVNQVHVLPYPLTPHVTLAYYNRNGFPADSGKKLNQIVSELNQHPHDVLLETSRLFYQHFTDMREYRNIFCLEK